MHLWLPQEAERSLHVARQHLQDTEDARSSAEEKVACLEAALQHSASRLAQVCTDPKLLIVASEYYGLAFREPKSFAPSQRRHTSRMGCTVTVSNGRTVASHRSPACLQEYEHP